MEPSQRTEALRLSAMALDHARRNDWEKAVEVLHKLNTDFQDGEGIQVMMLALADTVVTHQGGPLGADEFPVPVFIDIRTGEVDNVDDIRPEIAWAGRFIAARAADDYETCAALVNSTTGDEDWYRCVLGLLEAAAATLNATTGTPA